MKRFLYLGIIFSIVIIGCKKEEKVTNKGIIYLLAGKVTIETKGKKVKAKVKDVIEPGSVIITGKNSFAQIYLGKGSIKVMENSKIVFTKLLIDKETKGENTELFVAQGKVFSRIKRKLVKKESYIIRTKTSVASVRGTEFLVSDEGKKSNIACINGKVQVDKADGSKSVVINGGQEVNVQDDKDMNVVNLKKENLKNIEDIKKNFIDARDEIRKSYKETRDMIFKEVKDMKEKNQKMVDDQKQKDKKNIDKIKGDYEKNKKDVNKVDEVKSKNDVQKMKDKQKNIKDGIMPDMKGIKPDMNKNN